MDPHPLVFDNSYFKNLMSLEWRPKTVEASGKLQHGALNHYQIVTLRPTGNLQYEATDPSGDTLMMLPTDMALRTDPVFAQHARAYAGDQVCISQQLCTGFVLYCAAIVYWFCVVMCGNCVLVLCCNVRQLCTGFVL